MTTQVLRRPRVKFVSKQTLEQVGTALRELPEKTPETLSLRQTIEQLREPIEAALAKGYSYEELVPMLAQQGIDIQPSTLKRYVLTRSDRSPRKRSSTGETKPRRTRNKPSQTATGLATTDEIPVTADLPEPTVANEDTAKAASEAESLAPATSRRRRRTSAEVSSEPTATDAQSKTSKQTRSRQTSTETPSTAQSKSRTTSTRGRKTAKA
ncbi:MAG: hypothetical protein HC769_17625 [Cyanobacteria bacterium CRU_2_1]|nr:hypothetical protein [Cyanobacteria bacterium RU_5_0]NJR60488.1 hypothetical protein [Cyanobacteria bacterium CRU_2_1]